MKVLVVEDDLFLSTAYRAKLAHAGFELQVAKNGLEALEILRVFKPDVILLDLIMPKMDGFATLTQLKSQENLKDIPVIVASNLDQKQDFDKARQLGAIDCIVKSNLSLDALVERLRELDTTT